MMKVKPVKLGKTERMSFSHIDEVISMPNLIEVQKNSYQWFLDEGLKEVFHDIGTIEDYTGNLALSFVDFRLDKEPKYSIKECKERDVTYAAPLRVTARLLNKETGEVKDQEIFMGDFPLMTDAGTFVINGAERAIVSQLVRSPGVFYGDAKDKVGNDLYSATMNPNRGAWLEYETDAANVFYVRIDKNRKLPVTVLCRALGLSSDEEILNFFGEDERILATLEKDTTKNQDEGLLEVYRKLRPGEPPTVESATSQIDMLFFDPRRYDLSRFGRYKMNKKLSLARRIMNHVAAENVVDPFTGEILVEADKKIDRKLAEQIDAAGVDLVVLKIDDPMKDQPHKVKVITNGCVDAQAIIDSYYPAFKGVDVKECGINERCNLKELRKILDNASSAEEVMESLKKDHDLLIGRTVTIDDILSSINYLNGLGYGIGTTDDIAAWSGYLHCGFNNAAVAGEDTPYYSPYQKAVFAVMRAWTAVYSVVLTVCVLCAVLFRLIHLFTNLRKKHTAETVVPWLLLFGIFGIALLRCAMIAFVEVSSFGIGTSTMYLATVHPLLAVYAFTGLFLYGRPIGKKRKDNA